MALFAAVKSKELQIARWDPAPLAIVANLPYEQILNTTWSMVEYAHDVVDFLVVEIQNVWIHRYDSKVVGYQFSNEVSCCFYFCVNTCLSSMSVFSPFQIV